MDPKQFQSINSELAAFRYQIRKFLRFSESAARDAGITPQQHQLLLGIAGFNGTGRARISELADFLQERHHSVVGLVDRAEESRLVKRTNDSSDRRVVYVSLTAVGYSVLEKLSLEHLNAVRQLRQDLLRFGQSGTGADGSMHAEYSKAEETHSPRRL